MLDFDPVAFDIETSGLDGDAVLTVAGFAHDLGESLVLNVARGTDVNRRKLVTVLDSATGPDVAIRGKV